MAQGNVEKDNLHSCLSEKQTLYPTALQGADGKTNGARRLMLTCKICEATAAVRKKQLLYLALGFLRSLSQGIPSSHAQRPTRIACGIRISSPFPGSPKRLRETVDGENGFSGMSALLQGQYEPRNLAVPFYMRQ